MAMPDRRKSGWRFWIRCLRWAVRSGTLQVGYPFISLGWKTSSLTGRTEGYGDNEELIGKWFKRTGKRDQVRSTLVLRFENI